MSRKTLALKLITGLALNPHQIPERFIGQLSTGLHGNRCALAATGTPYMHMRGNNTRLRVTNLPIKPLQFLLPQKAHLRVDVKCLYRMATLFPGVKLCCELARSKLQVHSDYSPYHNQQHPLFHCLAAKLFSGPTPQREPTKAQAPTQKSSPSPQACVTHIQQPPQAQIRGGSIEPNITNCCLSITPTINPHHTAQTQTTHQPREQPPHPSHQHNHPPPYSESHSSTPYPSLQPVAMQHHLEAYHHRTHQR